MQEENYGDSNASPTRTKGATLNRRRTLDASPSPKLKSPTKLKRLGSPEKAARSGADGRREGLGTPTSVTMMNTFIIKNADHSFDQYH